MDSSHNTKSHQGKKLAVSLTARVGAERFPTCSRTGSGLTAAAAFDAAGALIMKGLKKHTAPDGQEIQVTVKSDGSDIVIASATTLSAAITSARRSLLEKKSGGEDHAAR
jgi:hypothetical protein